MSVSGWSGSMLAWEGELGALKARLGPVFGRPETRESFGGFVDGLLSGVARKTGWLLAEQAGLDRPWRMQALLGRSHWDADRLRDAVRGYVIEALGEASGVLVVDGEPDQPYDPVDRSPGERLSEERRAFGRGGAAIFGHRGADRELPGRGVCRLCQQVWSGADRPAALSSRALGQG